MRRAGAAVLAIALVAIGCHRSLAADADAGPGGAVVTAPSTVAPGAPKAGMVWIPAGTLRAGSALEDVPRVADAEMPGVDVALGGFYIDVLPFPDEPGAIPSTNVSRDEAATLCQSKGKRLCSELEWERACKGPDNSRYEYGATYDPHVCGTDLTARRPSGELTACKSGFGVREMHGGPREWTDSPWNRGNASHGDGAQGVVRGGNDAAGEVATRCAFGRPMTPSSRSPITGFRCCAGPRNDDEVQLAVHTGVPFQKAEHTTRNSPPLDALGGTACGPPLTPAPCFLSRAWIWRPVPNVELSLAGGCVGHDPNARCAVAVSRVLPALAGQAGDKSDTLAQVDTGREIPEVVLVEGAERRIRVRGADLHGQFFREVIYSYGRVDVKEVH
ncbi:MAG TPA: SUMF1/EgtB/PvdO family nonheme iron enzyme [Polyangiaceae bacterium]